MLDILIKNGTLIDGTGNPSLKGTIGIRDGKIVMHPADLTAKETVDAAGKIVCPGFIDAHSHGDLILGTGDARLFKTTQGVTTECMGQCGLSMVPAVPENLEASKNMLTMGTTYFPEDMKNWSSYDRFLDYASKQKMTCNGKQYIGHSNLRIAVMGMADRPATDKELDTMKGILREAMEDGCAGFSTGLIYTPSCYAKPEEIIELAKVIEPFNGIYASHMRNEGKYIVDACDEDGYLTEEEFSFDNYECIYADGIVYTCDIAQELLYLESYDEALDDWVMTPVTECEEEYDIDYAIVLLKTVDSLGEYDLAHVSYESFGSYVYSGD